MALLGVLVLGGRLVHDVIIIIVHKVVISGVGHLGLYLCVTGGMTFVLGGGVVRESATSLTSGSQKPIGSHLLHQPPCWFGELRRTSPPSHDYYFMRSKEVKKSGEPVPGVRRATVCCAGPRGRRAAAGGHWEAPRGSSERSRPLNGLAALILRAPTGSYALRQRRERSRRAAPPVSARIEAGAESP